MSTKGHPIPLQDGEAERSASEGVSSDANRRLEDRIALFWQGLEQAPGADFGYSQQAPRHTATEGFDSVRFPKSTADPVHSESQSPQVLVLLNKDRDDTATLLPSNSAVVSPPARGRGKRTRYDAPLREEFATDSSGTAMAVHGGEMIARARVRPVTASFGSPAHVLPCHVSTVQQRFPDVRCEVPAMPSTAPGQTTIDIPVLGPIQAVDVEALTNGSGVPYMAPMTPFSTPGNNSEQTSEASRMTALEKAKLDWETHICAMEQVLEANRAQGLPNPTVSLDALQLLSQMVSNLYTLNSKLLYAQTQCTLDEHRRNTARIDEVFQGLAGLQKPQANDD